MAVLSGNENNAESGAQQRMPSEFTLLLSLYRILIESNDLSSGLRSALEIVCQFTDCVVGTAWLPSEDPTQLRLCSSWHRDEPKLAEFIETCQQQSYLRDVGIPGRVWQRAKEEWTRNLAAEPVELFPMAPAAQYAGLKAAFAVPITHDNQVDGVLMFHMREVKEDDERLVLGRVAVPAPNRAGLVSPDVRAYVAEAGRFAQLGHMPRRLAWLVRAGDPADVVWAEGAISHWRSS